jgi:hypothetical protein
VITQPCPVRARPLATLAGALLLLSGLGCGNAVVAFGTSPAAAAATADRMLAAFAFRFTNVVRTPKFFAARSKLARAALAPSRVFDDTSVWNGGGGASRSLLVQGAFANNRYTFDARPDAAAPARLGDSRHLMRLDRIGDGEYEWNTGVDLAMGEVTADQVAALFAGTLATAAARGDAALRADYRRAFPRAATVLGRLFTVDSVHGVPTADGASAVTLVLSLHSDRLKADYPAFSEYVKKYVEPSRYRFVLRDRTGARWFDAAARDNRLVIRLRTVNGRLAPLEGAVRPMPSDLLLDVEFFVKIALFTVGVSDMHADFTVIHTPHERGWDIHFRQEPSWHLPLITARLVRGALRRPFDRGGSALRLTVRDSAGAQTLLTRRVHFPVQESTLVRWLGALGGSAAGDFAGTSEAEENRFQADIWNALRADIRAAR